MKGPPTDSFNFACFLILGHMFHCLLEVQQSGMVEIFSQLFYLAIKVFIYLSFTFPITSSWGLIYQCIEQISESLSNFPVMFIHTCITTFHYLEPSLTTNGKHYKIHEVKDHAVLPLNCCINSAAKCLYPVDVKWIFVTWMN